MRTRLTLALLALAAPLACLAGPASAQVFTVTSQSDPNNSSCIGTPSNCTLRQAINAANGTATNDSISVPAGDYNLSLIQGQLSVNKPAGTLEIQATGAEFDVSDFFRVMTVAAGSTLTIVGATLRRGRVELASNAFGGGLQINAATVTLNNTTVSESDAVTAPGGSNAYGGGIYLNDGNLTLNNSTVTGNTANSGNFNANGGGIFNRDAQMTITNSTISGNQAITAAPTGSNAQGGGIHTGTPSEDASTTITRSTISGNTAHSGDFNADGGGVYNTGGLSRTALTTITDSAITGNNAIADDTNSGGAGVYNSAAAANPATAVNITNSTISANNSTAANNGFGGGLYSSDGTMTLTNATVADNAANEGGGGVNNSNAAVTLTNSLLARNSAPTGPDCDTGGTYQITSGDHNLIENVANCTLAGATAGNVIGQSALLGPLALNGGATLNQALGAGSPALDKIPTSKCPPPATDQRGVTRPQGPACDIGAYELEVPAPAPPAALSLKLGGAKSQRLSKKGLKITATCGSLACQVAASASVTLPRVRKSSASAKKKRKRKKVNFKKLSASVGAGQTSTLRLKLSKRSYNKLKRALKKRKSLNVKLSATATDSAKRSAKASLTIKLKPPKAKKRKRR